mgnify:CR=1 FL=1
MSIRTYHFRLRDDVPLGRLDAREWSDEYDGDADEVSGAIVSDFHRYGTLLVDVVIRWSDAQLELRRERDDAGVPCIEWTWCGGSEVLATGYAKNEEDALHDAIVMEP